MSTREEKIQLATDVDSSGALKGLKEVEAGAARMATTVSDSAGKAGAKIDALGDSGAKASTKLDANTRSITASIQRATAAAEAGEKGTTKFYESLARQRGVDVSALQPYLQQLEQARQRTDGLTISTGQYTNALRMVPAQMTDIFTSLAGGQNPLLVLIQQGGQLKDQFGGIGVAAKAVGGYVAGMVNPFTVAAAAAGGIAIAFEAGSREERGFRNALILSGNQAGATAGQMQQMAARIDAIVGTQGRASEALIQFAKSGQVGAQSLEAFATAAIRWEDATGQAVGDTVKQFEELRKSPLDAVLKLNEGTGFLTTSIYAQVKALEEEGRTVEAANVAQKAYADTLAQRATEMQANLGLVERGWRGIKNVVAEAWDAIKSIGRTAGPEGQLAASKTALAALEQQAESRRARGLATGDLDRQIEAVRQSVDMRREEVRLLDRAARIQAEQVANTKLLADFDKEGEQFKTKAAKMAEEVRRAEIEGRRLIVAGLITEADLHERIADIRKKYEDKSSGVRAGQSEVAAIRARVLEAQRELDALRANPENYGTDSQMRLNEGENLAIKIKEELAAGIKGVARADKELALSEAEVLSQVLKVKDAEELRLRQQRDLIAQGNKQIAAINEDAAAIERKAMALEAENAVWGKSRAAIEAATLARMQANAADVAGFENSGDVVAALNAKTEAQKRYVDALKASELKTFSQRGDEVLRQAQEMRDAYAEELRMTGLSALDRQKIVAVRQVELKYAKLIADVERSSLDDAEKRAQIGKLIEAKGIETSAAVNKVLLDDFTRTSAQIEQSLTDALMRGFESGKGFAEVLRDTVVNMFKTMVLRPVVQATVQSGMNALGLEGLQQGGGALGTISNLGSLYNAGSTAAGWLGLGAATGTGLAATAGTGLALSGAGAGLGLGASMGTGLGLAGAGTGLGLTASAGAGTALAAGAASAGASFAAAIPYIGWAIAAISFLKGFDDSGTLHMGGAGAFSADMGSVTGADSQAYTGFGLTADQYTSVANSQAGDIAKSLVGMLDTTATAFGSSSRYSVGTGFADDSSKDGAWGALRVTSAGETMVDWGQGADKWPGREFSDGEAGRTEYLNAVAKDVRDTLMKETPDWADAMLQALGDAPTIEQLTATVAQINQVQAALVSMGAAVPELADLADSVVPDLLAAFGGVENMAGSVTSYVDAMYTQAEKSALGQKQLRDALGDVTEAMPMSIKQWRDLAAAQDLNTESGRQAYATLVKLGPAFAAQVDSMLQAAGISGDAIADILRDGLLGRLSAEDVGAKMSDLVITGIYNGLAVGPAQGIAQMFVDSIVTPMLTAVTTGGTIAGVVSQASIDAVVQKATQAAAQISAILNDPAFKAAMASVTSSISQITASVTANYQAPQVVLASTTSYIESAADRAKAAWQGAYDVLGRAVDAQRQLAQEQLQAATQIFDLTSMAAAELRNQGGGDAMAEARARAYIEQSLATLRTTGYLPDYEGLQQAVQTASSALDGKVYATLFEQQRDRLTLAGQLQAIADLAEPQKDAAEQQLDYLDGLLSTAQHQLDALNGVNNSVLGVADALKAWWKATGTSTAKGTATYGALPAFADGGSHSGGWALVGERGPELAFMPPARIYTNTDSQALLRTEKLEQLMTTLIEENRDMRQRLQAIESNTSKTAYATALAGRVLDDAARGVQPLSTEGAA